MNKQTLIFTGILVSGGIVWRISERLSPDAVGLAVGVFLGAMVAIPLCYVVMSQNRRREAYNEPDREKQITAPASPQLVIISQQIDKQVMVNNGQAWKIPQPAEIETDQAYPIEYR